MFSHGRDASTIIQQEFLPSDNGYMCLHLAKCSFNDIRALFHSPAMTRNFSFVLTLSPQAAHRGWGGRWVGTLVEGGKPLISSMRIGLHFEDKGNERYSLYIFSTPSTAKPCFHTASRWLLVTILLSQPEPAIFVFSWHGMIGFTKVQTHFNFTGLNRLWLWLFKWSAGILVNSLHQLPRSRP